MTMKNEMNAQHYEIGMVGLGVMGRNLVLNMADHGFPVAGYDKDPAKLNSESGKHELGIHGDNKTGHFLIHEPGLMSIPISQIPPKPNELLFAHSDAESTVTVFIWQQSNDVVMIALTAAVR